MKDKVKLIRLSSDQISQAKKANGESLQITHAVVCGEYGQLFGTEKQCRKYYSAWSSIFPHIFSGGEEIEQFKFVTYKTTPELVMVLIDCHDPMEKTVKMGKMASKSQSPKRGSTRRKGFLTKLLGL